MGGEGVFIFSQWLKVIPQKGRYLIGKVRGYLSPPYDPHDTRAYVCSLYLIM